MSLKSIIRAFTLIELLIVVAIIAILAAIAVPNFLEAQTRAKVSRTLSDMRSIRTAIESYVVDTNEYPELDTGVVVLTQAGVGMIRLTTPISYISTIPASPWPEKEIGFPAGSPKNANKFNIYLYVRALGPNPPGVVTVDAAGFDENYKLDRVCYLRGEQTVLPGTIEFSRMGYWGLKSVGPNNWDDRDGSDLTGTRIGTIGNARLYDPTNGTVSAGDIVTYGDRSTKAEEAD